MQVKEYLGTVNRLNRIIQNKLADLYQLKELSISVPAVDNKERVQTTSEPDKIGALMAKIDKMERDIDHRIDEYVGVRDKIIEQITDITDEKYYNVLFSKYIENKTLETVASETERSFKHVTRLHGEALTEFDRKYGGSYHSISGLGELLKTVS